jgi:hypothetical protein
MTPDCSLRAGPDRPPYASGSPHPKGGCPRDQVGESCPGRRRLAFDFIGDAIHAGYRESVPAPVRGRAGPVRPEAILWSFRIKLVRCDWWIRDKTSSE